MWEASNYYKRAKPKHHMQESFHCNHVGKCLLQGWKQQENCWTQEQEWNMLNKYNDILLIIF